MFMTVCFGERLDANSFHQLVAPSALTWRFAAESLLVDLGSPSNQRQVTGDPAAPLPPASAVSYEQRRASLAELSEMTSAPPEAGG